ncbi:S9 family peptidase [Pelagibacteraceae bacterium]|jgi:oligopeptidase B|nr:S9 family peptidase [Pelagibacteraceae bacterium]
MNIPKLSKQPTIKSCHGISWEDDFSWVHQENILEVLKDGSKLLPDVKKYLDEENAYTQKILEDTKPLQKKLFEEIKSRIKLDDESLPYKDKNYEYWTKVTKDGNYSKKLRRKIGDSQIQTYWDGDIEAKGKKFFSTGDVAVSHNDQFLAYSIDDKGSEYFTIFIRRISDNKIIEEPIPDTSGGITWSYDDQYFFYSKLDKFHRPRQIFRHKIGTTIKEDTLIFEEQDDRFTCGIGTSSDEKFYFISTSEHTTSEVYYFNKDETKPEPKLILERKEGVEYSLDSWGNYFWMHTNRDAKDFEILRCKNNEINDWEDFIPAKNEVLIGGFVLLNNWMVRSERVDALPKLFVRNLKTNEEEELKISDEEIISPGMSLGQKDRNTDTVRISYESPKTPTRTYEYNLANKEKKLLKELEIPSGYERNNYIVKRVNCLAHDGRKIPITITYHKDTKLDGSANLLLYGYGSYGHTISPSFSTTRLSLINRNIIWATAHIRGGMERGMKYWEEGKMLNKKNTFKDYISCAKHLIDQKYTSKGKIIGYGGSAGGLLMGAVVNESPELFLGMIMAVPFVDSLTTNLDHSLPLTAGEFNEFGNAKENIEHFKYIKSYSPYHNIKKMDYPHILITTSLSDNRVLFDEPTKFTAKLRDTKTDNNLLLFKCEMDAGHGGKSGRDAAIEEVAFDYAFALKITDKLNT